MRSRDLEQWQKHRISAPGSVSHPRRRDASNGLTSAPSLGNAPPRAGISARVFRGGRRALLSCALSAWPHSHAARRSGGRRKGGMRLLPWLTDSWSGLGSRENIKRVASLNKAKLNEVAWLCWLCWLGSPGAIFNSLAGRVRANFFFVEGSVQFHFRGCPE